MKEETANRIADELEELLSATGFSATEVLGAMLGAPVPKPYRKLALIGYKAGWKSMFKPMPEPNSKKLAESLAMIQAFKSTPHKMKSFMQQTIKNLPHAPGGAPRKIKTEEELSVCGEIMGLRAELDTREAIRRVAAKRGVSDRTIYRVWGKYHPKKKKRIDHRP